MKPKLTLLSDHDLSRQSPKKMLTEFLESPEAEQASSIVISCAIPSDDGNSDYMWGLAGCGYGDAVALLEIAKGLIIGEMLNLDE